MSHASGHKQPETTNSTGASRQPQQPSGQHNPPEQTPLSQEELDRDTFAREKSGQLQSIVDQFYEGHIGQGAATKYLLDTLEFSAHEQPSKEKEAIFNEYLQHILARQASLDSAADRGQPRMPTLQPSDNSGGAKRPFPIEETDSDGEDGPTKSSKFPKMEFSDMPFFADEAAGSIFQHPSCAKSQELLMRFAATGIPQVKQFIAFSSSRSKPSFPASQWERIIRGDAVDIDTVFSDLHRVEPLEENVGRLGDLDIRFKAPEPKKRVTTQGDWTSAWNQIERATRFLFKHRADELRTYGEWMQDEFAAKNSTSHIRLIRYDAALRREVAGGTNVLLTDETRFGRLYKAIVLPDGCQQSATNTTPKEDVLTETVVSGTPVCLAPQADIRKRTVTGETSEDGCGEGDEGVESDDVSEGRRKGRRDEVKSGEEWKSEGLRGETPKFLRYNLFETAEEVMDLRTTAEWTETAEPIPCIPNHERDNPAVQATLKAHPDLFKVETPINIDNFEDMLRNHPNRPFVDSVVHGLRHGFWPWADTRIGEYPEIVHEKRGPPVDEVRAEFLRKKRDEEVAKGHYSQPFKELSPGMYCMPIHAVPKSDIPGDLRLVSDQSAGEYSLNSMVDDAKIRHFPLDNMTHVAEMLLHHRATHPNEELVMFKCDIADAYRLLPMHPCWQVKQIVPVDDEFHADRRNMFGGKGSGSLFIAFNALVAWILKYVLLVAIVRAYVDDSFGFEKKGRLTFYKPYNKHMPTAQVRILHLWDHLGIPHKEKKQVSGTPLTIIGISVDPNAMTFTFPEDAKKKLVGELWKWGRKTTKRAQGSFRVREWQVLTGWMNWAFNVYPQLRPALNNIYFKLKGVRQSSSKRLWVNNDIRADLLWAARALQRASGVHIIRSLRWPLEGADITIYADACMEGMGFWIPNANLGFYSPVPFTANEEIIFFWEATCVLAALNYAHAVAKDFDKIVIYTDNTNTVDIFISLHCLPAYNAILIQSMSIVLLGRYDLRVVHVPGDNNAVADALSRNNFSKALDLAPDLQIRDFQPPPCWLGATQK